MKKLIIFILCLLLFSTSISLANGAAIKSYFIAHDTTPDLDTLSSGIYSALKLVGIILAVCVMTTMAIQWFIASPGKKAMLKERFIYYFAGVIFLIAGLAFLTWYEQTAKDVANTFSDPTTNYNSLKTSTNNLAKKVSDYKKERNELQKQRDSIYDEYVDLCNTANSQTTEQRKDMVLQVAEQKLKTVNDLDNQISNLDTKIKNSEEQLEYLKEALTESYYNQE